MIVQLIKASPDQEHSIYDKWMMPLDLISIATYLNKFFPDIEIEIIDGQVISPNEVICALNPEADIVGIGYTVFSARNMFNISTLAKSNGSLVVIGGQAATAEGINLIANNPQIDIVVRYDGEIPFLKIVEQVYSNKNIKYFSKIPNSIFLDSDNNLIEGDRIDYDLNEYYSPDRNIGGLNIENYISRYKNTCTEKRLIANRPTNSFSKKGCQYNCSFCGRVDKVKRCRSAEIVYNEYKKLKEIYSIDYIYDHSDTWIDNRWMYDFLNLYETKGSLELKYMIFGDVRDIDRKTAQLMKYLGVDIVLLGIESGSNKILKKNNKNMTVNQILKCISLLSKEGIKISASFVFGLLGENMQTLKETSAFMQQLREMGDVTIYSNIIIPLPGSYIWKKLAKNKSAKQLIENTALYNLEKIRNIYINEFTDIPGGLEYLRELRDLTLSDDKIPVLEYAR